MSLLPRIIARLDIKGPNLIKGIQLEGLRVIGDPRYFALRYYQEGIDEIIFIDAVASLYGRNSLKDIIKATASEIFIPLTVAGGIRTVEDVHEILCSGADKVAVNSAAVRQPKLIREIAQRFGSQCMVLQIDAKRKKDNGWEVYIDGGREHGNRDVMEWADQGVALGAGEILLTSVDREGTRQGFDLELVHAVAGRVSVPVIASGGFGKMSHLTEVLKIGRADAAAIGGALHYGLYQVQELHNAVKESSTVHSAA